MLPTPRSTSEEVEQEAARVVSRLGTLSPTKVPASVAAASAQRLADLARAAEGLPPLPVPDLRPHGWASLVRVLVADLLAVGATEAQLAAARDELTALRRALP
ncbi:hypothetical protein [Aquipuribacter hungaricus]|uniref:Uncharacterized protein n=1 Tax=Aquipuribacter hungaricus TaxID=545624 RepID=A0ABV7WBI9_9MICO